MIPEFRYYTLEEAAEELGRRERQRQLVAEWWDEQGYGTPPFPAAEDPLAMWCRSIALPTYEVKAVTIMARAAGFMPVFADLYTDTFSLDSGSKKSAVDRHVVSGRGRSGGLKVARDRLYTGKVEDLLGRPMGEIETRGGVLLPDYHAALYTDIFGADEARVDFSDWVKGGHVRDACAYYAMYLSWFVGHTVLLDDYHDGQSGSKLVAFLRKVVNPAYREVVRLFGTTPLIVRAPWADHFDYYPAPGSDWRSHGIIPDEILVLEQ